MVKLEGSIVALVTPMTESGAIDYDNLGRLLEFHIDAGTHGIVAVGTTGESATLAVDEHLKVVKYCIEQIKGRIPLIAGTGANSTSEAIHLTQQAAGLGADACLLVVPYYNKPNQRGLITHFEQIALAVDIPQILYNVPGRTVADLSNQSVEVLADIDNIIAIKDATGDIERGRALIEACGHKVAVLSGDDATALDLMRVGGRGDISVTANVAPHLMSQMCTAALSGDFDKAAELDTQLQVLHEGLFIEANPMPVKYAVSKMGYTHNTLRLPLVALDNEEQATVDGFIKPFI
ncbi:MAG: 4-hydroxy-tetrahydrodipicolinate synthase [Pseudomonadota bacterium]